MSNLYVPTYRAVKTSQILENAELDGADYITAQQKLADVAFLAYANIREANNPVVADLPTKEASVAGFVSAALALHEAHKDTGVKVAASPEYVAAIIEKLATAVFVDEVLQEQLSMLEGDTKIAAEQCQRLGREYVLSLIAELLP